VTAVSQTGGPETVLCGEAELPYALLGYATDYANGVQDEPTPVQTLIDMMAASTETFRARARAAVPRPRRPPHVAPAGIVLPLRELAPRTTATRPLALAEIRSVVVRGSARGPPPPRTRTPS
jgi:hypothetical protein